jgi:hypothetical protein
MPPGLASALVATRVRQVAHDGAGGAPARGAARRCMRGGTRAPHGHEGMGGGGGAAAAAASGAVLGGRRGGALGAASSALLRAVAVGCPHRGRCAADPNSSVRPTPASLPRPRPVARATRARQSRARHACPSLPVCYGASPQGPLSRPHAVGQLHERSQSERVTPATRLPACVDGAGQSARVEHVACCTRCVAPSSELHPRMGTAGCPACLGHLAHCPERRRGAPPAASAMLPTARGDGLAQLDRRCEGASSRAALPAPIGGVPAASRRAPRLQQLARGLRWRANAPLGARYAAPRRPLDASARRAWRVISMAWLVCLPRARSHSAACHH